MPENLSEQIATEQVEQFKILIPVMAERWGVGWQDPDTYQLLVDVFCLGLKMGTDATVEIMRKKLTR